jgi:hypothetical protein
MLAREAAISQRQILTLNGKLKKATLLVTRSRTSLSIETKRSIDGPFTHSHSCLSWKIQNDSINLLGFAIC